MENTTPGNFVSPDIVVSHFHLRESEVVVDFGAGSGAYLPTLSKMVGTNGRVYACEIQKGLVEKIGALVREKKLANVETLWCDIEAVGGTKLRDGVADAGLLANTLFQLEDKTMALTEVARVIKKAGRLFVIEWSDSFGGMGPQPQFVIPEAHTKAFVEQAGFSFERTFPAGDHHYGLVFRRLS